MSRSCHSSSTASRRRVQGRLARRRRRPAKPSSAGSRVIDGQDHHGDDHRRRQAHGGDGRDAGQGQAADGDDDRAAGEHHRLAGGGDGPPGGVGHGQARPQLAAVAGDDEQGVVDADAHADHRRQGARLGRDVEHEAGDEDQSGARAEADGRDGEGQAHGDDRAEGDQQDDHRAEHAQHLGRARLGLLGVLRQVAAELDLEAGGAGGGHRLLELLVGLGAQLLRVARVLHPRQRGAPVGRHQPDRLGVDDGRDPRQLAEAVDQVGDRPLVGAGAEVAVLGVDHDLGAAAGGLGEALGEHVERLLRLDVRDAEVGGVTTAGRARRAPEDGGGRQPGNEDQPAALDGEPAEAM